MLVQAEIWTVARSEQGNAVLVRPIGSESAVPIIIGQAEAQSIMIGLANHAMPRPLTHDLLISIIKRFDTKVVRVEITELKDGTFYGRLILNKNGKDVSIDSRPSDCLALAVRVKCPIFIDEMVVDQAGVSVNIVEEAAEAAMSTKSREIEDELNELKKRLDKAVEEENYEEAAMLRDRINELEKNG
jgi:bifunctional DNase/RNase